MGKSSRSSAIKKNNQVLKARVFGPVESARIERQNAKLLALVQAPKELVMKDAQTPEPPTQGEAPPKEVEEKEEDGDAMHIETVSSQQQQQQQPKPRSKRELVRMREARKLRRLVQLRGGRSHPRNQREFPQLKKKFPSVRK